MFSSSEAFHFSARCYSDVQLASVRHFEELPATGSIFLNIDHRHAGLGGDDGWTPNLRAEYRIPTGYYQYGLSFQPYQET